MNAVDAIAAAAQMIGYRAEAVVRNYTFADVLHPATVTRAVPLAAFTQTPPSYRSAAFAVVDNNCVDALRLVAEHRALGAPLLFVVEANDVAVWQVRNVEPPRVIERSTISQLSSLFEQNSTDWRPDAIHRAKAVGSTRQGVQLDFIDLGLLPAIEGEIHAKLDRLLVETLAAAMDVQSARKLDMRALFRVVFRLLAAKVLQDRGHVYSANWNPDDLRSVLNAIEGYYSLPPVMSASRQSVPVAYEAAWQQLRKGISFSNISADDLAFVYENTLVTPEVRKLFGTHSTPRQVAEYVVERLELHRHSPESLNIYEPFAGAGVFLVSALRHLRDLLPVNWSDQQRHDFLVSHLSGDEVDAFACEVASLSLILADYPNHNGWNIRETDLFEGDTLKERIGSNNVILCNPPFEAFTSEERQRYALANHTYSKPITVLNAALTAHPLALGFVLPRPFILERQFAEQRQRIERLYGSVEIVELPEGTFAASDIESSLLIAIEPRPPAPQCVTLRSTDVADRDCAAFLKTGVTTSQRELARPLEDKPSGNLWIPPLARLWDYLAFYPRLGDHLRPSLGLQWTYAQRKAFSQRRQPGFRKGVHNARHIQQFILSSPVWLDYRKEFVRRAYGQEWNQPKLILNAARTSRGPWRMGAAFDNEGLLFSQQFYGLWPKGTSSEKELLSFTAVLNGPVANAFIAVHSPASRIRLPALEQIPMPKLLPTRLAGLISDYLTVVSEPQLLRDNSERLRTLLMQIDAVVLEAYDLPPRLEQELFDYFRGSERPVSHPWVHWDVEYPVPGLRLAERVSGRFQPKGNWPAEIFTPLPENEAALLREYGN
jgi:N-6 DNA Methylase